MEYTLELISSGDFLFYSLQKLKGEQSEDINFRFLFFSKLEKTVQD